MRTVKHVLVVDDEPAIVEIVRDYLSDAGYRVSTAHSGDEALSQVRSIRPDLIVLDLGLPGLDGLDVARTIRQSLGVPIIMLTARSDEAESAEISSPPHQWADKRSPQATFVERWNLVVLVRSSRVSLRDPDGGHRSRR